MSVSNHLLTDDQMRQFISRGYVVLQTDFPKEFHEGLNAKLNEVMDKEGNPGNNLLPRFSEVGDILQNPVVRGALTSVVGHDYTIHPHRHCHFTYPGRKVQDGEDLSSAYWQLSLPFYGSPTRSNVPPCGTPRQRSLQPRRQGRQRGILRAVATSPRSPPQSAPRPVSPPPRSAGGRRAGTSTASGTRRAKHRRSFLRDPVGGHERRCRE